VAEFLTDAWVAELGVAAAGASVPADLHLVVQQVVLHDRGDETAFAIRIADGAVTVEPGRASDADLSFTQDRATAAAIAQGELSAQAAFMAGRLRVGGDLREVMERSRALATIDDIFAAPRASTTW
jgi:putative sterol carrier protein